MRDGITWLTAKPGRWNAAVYGGIGYGVLMLATALVSY
jgi:hypothetical protein